jgi:hypothetical protein
MPVIEGELIAGAPKDHRKCEGGETEGAGVQIPAA